MEFDLAHAYREQRKHGYVPGEFERNKFGEYTDEDVAAMAGLPVERLGWGLWLVRKTAPILSLVRSRGNRAA